MYKIYNSYIHYHFLDLYFSVCLQCKIQVSVCTYFWSWDSMLRIVIRLWAGQSRVQFLAGARDIVLFLNHPHWLWVLFSCLWWFLPYVWGCWGMNPTTYLYLDLRLKMSEVGPLLHLYVFSMCTEAVLLYVLCFSVSLRQVFFKPCWL